MIRSMEDSIRIVNVIVSSNINSTLDIRLLANNLPNSIYEPESFPGLIYRRINPKSTIIMFSTGKMTSIGTTSEELGKNCIHSTSFELSHIEKKNFQVENIMIENVVAKADVHQRVDIKKFYQVYEGVKFEPIFISN